MHLCHVLQRTNCSCLRGSVGACCVCIFSHVQFVISLVHYIVSKMCVCLLLCSRYQAVFVVLVYCVPPCLKCQYVWGKCLHSVYRQSCQSMGSCALVCRWWSVTWCKLPSTYPSCVPCRWLIQAVASSMHLLSNQGMCWT